MNVSWVYAESGCTLTDLQALADRELILLREQEIWRDPLGRRGPQPPEAAHASDAPLIFTEEQERAWRVIEAASNAAGQGASGLPLLLQGVTGSGKTELYLRAAKETVAAGRQVLMLVPEISLTPQTVDRFIRSFPGQVGLVHSKLSDGERYDTWRRARLGALKVIIGPRSALFAPLPEPGLIVVDECHDSSYHQTEPPFYDAVAAAQAYARICGAICILGSATPSVAQRYAADAGRLCALSSLAASPPIRPLRPPQNWICRRFPLSIFATSSRLAIGAPSACHCGTRLSGVLKQGEQAILFLNRRGTATHVFCRNCGTVVRCPRLRHPAHVPCLFGGEAVVPSLRI